MIVEIPQEQPRPTKEHPKAATFESVTATGNVDPNLQPSTPI
jgi:hypothetical protein